MVLGRSQFGLSGQQAAPLSHDWPSARPASAKPPTAAAIAQQLFAVLTKTGHLDHQGLLSAIADQSRSQLRIAEIILSRRLVPETVLYQALAKVCALSVLDPATQPPDPRLIDILGAEECLNSALLPWRSIGGVTFVLIAYPEELARHRDRLNAMFGTVAFALTPLSQIEACVNLQRGRSLARRAENKVAADVSCRDWQQREGRILSAGLIALAACALLFPINTYFLALFTVTFCLIPVTGLKLAALIAQSFRAQPSDAQAPAIARKPVVSIIVALYRESDIAGRLVRRLGRLDYPHDLLDVLLAVEEDDNVTLNALARTRLPPWMRVAVVPRGKVKTKPRALNFALNLCRGSIIGVYDAEDAPEADQINKIVQRFHGRGPQVACLQGILDFYNPTANWLARCFTLEYGGWFRVILPGLARLGMPIPLGGTTLFFRRDALIELGGWDAHNVTEDADLGMRLARRGYRTELIETVTYEEANCRALPWVKQRSRWIKGYMMTYAVHMRRPLQLFRELGVVGFLGFQILLLGSLLQVLLAPVLWSTLIFTSLHGMAVPSPAYSWLLAVILPLAIGSEIVSLIVWSVGLKRSGQPLPWFWIPTLIAYFPMASLASYKALWEAVMQPFYWDKTSHGHLSGSASKPKRAAPTPQP